MNELASIVIRSIVISGTATILASAWSILLAYLLSGSYRLRHIAYLLEALVGIPTVLVGLLLYMLLSNDGPLGFLQLLYTPQAIIIGEALLITPLITAVSYQALKETRTKYTELALSLGATQRQAAGLVITQSLPSLLAAIVMGYSRAIGELGVALIVGGNIKGLTRTITTSIALYTAMGEYENAIKLGLVLVVLTIGVSLLVRLVKRTWDLE